eukprot:scaffold66354_cov63-Phaeocystis_antarctica.AAC.4
MGCRVSRKASRPLYSLPGASPPQQTSSEQREVMLCGVSPSALRACTAAPCATSSLATPNRPMLAARCSGVCSLLAVPLSTAAPAASSSAATSALPLLAARCRGVLPS